MTDVRFTTLRPPDVFEVPGPIELPPDHSPQGLVREYLVESRRPLASLALITPLALIYELGVLWLGPQAMRNGVDIWLRQFLDRLGFSQYFLLPALTLGLLLAWHHATGDRWKLKGWVLYFMVAESALLGLVLVEIGHLQGTLLHHDLLAATRGGLGRFGFFALLIGFLGAGIYEEALFRLILLPAVAWLLKSSGGQPRVCVIGAVLITSAAFSAAHYVGVQGDAFSVPSFVFRFLAGIFFALLFVTRGFGVTACTHALYDIFVGLF